MTWPTKKLSTRQHRQEKGNSSEQTFEMFCNNNGIEFIHLDKNKEAREKFLSDPTGKSPDFWCQKDSRCIFVEVKTHTLLTNEARNKAMDQTIQVKRTAEISGTTIFGPFDPIPELTSPYGGYLRNASKKFKNIKVDCYGFPRILLLDVLPFRISDVRAVFSGLYPSFRQDGILRVFRKCIADFSILREAM